MRAIEDLKDNQLDLVENQKTKQSDPIGKIKFSDEKLNKLAEDVIKKTKKCENEDLEYTVAKGDKYNVNLYKNLEGFVKKIMNGELSIKKPKEKQDELWNLIYKMKKRTSEKREAKNLVSKIRKVGNELYNIRDKIIDALEKKKNYRVKILNG